MVFAFIRKKSSFTKAKKSFPKEEEFFLYFQPIVKGNAFFLQC